MYGSVQTLKLCPRNSCYLSLEGYTTSIITKINVILALGDKLSQYNKFYTSIYYFN